MLISFRARLLVLVSLLVVALQTVTVVVVVVAPDHEASDPDTLSEMNHRLVLESVKEYTHAFSPPSLILARALSRSQLLSNAADIPQPYLDSMRELMWDVLQSHPSLRGVSLLSYPEGDSVGVVGAPSRFFFASYGGRYRKWSLDHEGIAHYNVSIDGQWSNATDWLPTAPRWREGVLPTSDTAALTPQSYSRAAHRGVEYVGEVRFDTAPLLLHGSEGGVSFLMESTTLIAASDPSYQPGTDFYKYRTPLATGINDAVEREWGGWALLLAALQQKAGEGAESGFLSAQLSSTLSARFSILEVGGPQQLTVCSVTAMPTDTSRASTVDLVIATTAIAMALLAVACLAIVLFLRPLDRLVAVALYVRDSNFEAQTDPLSTNVPEVLQIQSALLTAVEKAREYRCFLPPDLLDDPPVKESARKRTEISCYSSTSSNGGMGIPESSTSIGVRHRAIAVMVSSVKNSITLLEDMNSELLIKAHQKFLQLVQGPVERMKGVSKTYGDTYVSTWNSKAPQAGYVGKAMEAAIAIGSSDLSNMWFEVLGIGVAKGLALCGNLGTNITRSYEVVGTCVKKATAMSDAGCVMVSTGVAVNSDSAVFSELEGTHRFTLVGLLESMISTTPFYFVTRNVRENEEWMYQTHSAMEQDRDFNRAFAAWLDAPTKDSPDAEQMLRHTLERPILKDWWGRLACALAVGDAAAVTVSTCLQAASLPRQDRVRRSEVTFEGVCEVESESSY